MGLVPRGALAVMEEGELELRFVSRLQGMALQVGGSVWTAFEEFE